MLKKIFLFCQSQQYAILMAVRTARIVVIFWLIEVKIVLFAMMTLKLHGHRHKQRHGSPLQDLHRDI